MSSLSPPYTHQYSQGIQLRFLTPHDIPEVEQLCSLWFPIEYPPTWYEDITSNPKFYSLAAILDQKIIGMLVCEVKPRTRCNREDLNMLANHFSPVCQVAYILSLGVLKEYRRNGIASLLLDRLIAYLTIPTGSNTNGTGDNQNNIVAIQNGSSKSNKNHKCKCIYLHVLTSNKAAINFYERRNFRQHTFLPYYYSIQGSPRDGYCYVLYINGGAPPWTITDYLKHATDKIMSSDPCGLPRRLFTSVAATLTTLATCTLHKITGPYTS